MITNFRYIGVDRHAVQNWRGPSEVIVLTKAEDAQPVANPAPMILVEPPPIEEWVGAYRIHGGVFFGLIQFLAEGDLFEVNLNPKAAENLELKPGAIFHINVDNPKSELEGVYLGENLQSARAVRQAVSRKGKRHLWEAQWARSDYPPADHLFFQPIDGILNVAPSDRNRWIPVEVTLSPSVLEH